jgi:hypothetical protein
MTLERARLGAAAGFLVGVFLSFLGFGWDVQWHTDVGPDTFFTAPHLVLYGGVAIAGLTCLAMVLLTTMYARRGATAALAGTTPILGGVFRGPLGYITGGFGALFFLLFGLMDQWWHTLYGFDVTLVSPPHVGLILSIMVTMAGCLMALAWHVRTAGGKPLGRLLAAAGVAFAAAVLVAFIMPTLVDLLPWALFGLISWPNIVVSALYPAAILTVVSVIRRPWAGTLFGMLFTALDLLVTAIMPGITQDYAASLGLFLRDTTSGEVIVSGLLPTFVLVAGMTVDLLLFAGRRSGWRLTVVVPVAGAVAALVLRVLEPNLPLYQPGPLDPAEAVARRAEIFAAIATSSLILAPFIGAAAGWFGWLLGIVLSGDVERAPAAKQSVLATAMATVLVLSLVAPMSVVAHASDPHHETIQAGPYEVLVGFSEWPLRAERSLDITFEPSDGIEGKSATIRITDPQGEVYDVSALGRHPRQRELWGLDLIALPAAGDWTIHLTVSGPQGSGTGTLNAIPVGERPGPPPAPMWLIAALPLFFLIWLGMRGWQHVRPGQTPEARSWA